MCWGVGDSFFWSGLALVLLLFCVFFVVFWFGSGLGVCGCGCVECGGVGGAYLHLRGFWVEKRLALLAFLLCYLTFWEEGRF